MRINLMCYCLKKHRLWLVALVVLVATCLSGCGQSFSVKQLGKGDIDFVADNHRNEVENQLYELMVKLYKRNPRELHKQLEPSIDAQKARLQKSIVAGAPLIIDGIEGVELLRQAFDRNYTGDRVFTLVGGMLSMVHQSYGYHTEFFLFDKLDQQKLYDSARNIEIVSWRLRTETDNDGQLLLESTVLTGADTNLSFERLIARLVSMQDMMARIAADVNRRTINGVAHGVARAVFIPL